MVPAPIPYNEQERIQALRRYDILDTEPEQDFDDIVDIAAYICDVPIALISLVDSDRQWYKAKRGIGSSESPRELAFCAHVVTHREPLIVPDTRLDHRFFDNPLVVDSPGIRFYVGTPLITADGYVLGSLCVIDLKPRHLTNHQIHMLTALSRQVVSYFELRRRTNLLKSLVEEKDKAERKIMEQFAFIQAMTSSMGEGVITLDQEARLTSMNPAAERMLGWTRDEIGDRNMHDLIHHTDKDGVPIAQHECPLTAARLAGKVFAAEGDVFWRKDGTCMPVAYVSAPIHLEEVVVGTVLTFHDITEQLRAREAINAALEAAKRASEYKSEFLASMSHEIRTPMTAIVGFVDLLIHSKASPRDMEEWTRSIHKNCDYLLTLVNDILDLSKIEAGQFEMHRVNMQIMDVLESVDSLMRPRATEKLLQFGIHVNTPVPAVMQSDPLRLQQILINLVNNAIKFTERGSVHVHVQFEAGHDKQMWMDVRVVDTGIGIPADRIDQLFAPFSQVHTVHKQRFGGTGLGLTISQRFAEKLGGKISVTSEMGRGSTFRLRLPLGAAEAYELIEPHLQARTESGSPMVSHPPVSLHGLRVLLADDNPDNRRIICFLLEEAGATVQAVENGAEAITAVATSADHPFGIVLMDMQMPVLDGYSAVRVLREQGVKTPILALTAYAMADDAEKCLAAGCNRYMAKPVRRDPLLRLIRTMTHGSPADSTTVAIEAAAASSVLVPTSPTPSPAVTAEGLEPLRSTEAGDLNFAPLLTTYVAHLHQSADKLNAAWLAADRNAIAALTHQLKGTGTSYGFPDITRVAGGIEDQLRGAQSLPALADSVRELETLLRRAAC